MSKAGNSSEGLFVIGRSRAARTGAADPSEEQGEFRSPCRGEVLQNTTVIGIVMSWTL